MEAAVIYYTVAQNRVQVKVSPFRMVLEVSIKMHHTNQQKHDHPIDQASGVRRPGTARRPLSLSLSLSHMAEDTAHARILEHVPSSIIPFVSLCEPTLGQQLATMAVFGRSTRREQVSNKYIYTIMNLHPRPGGVHLH